MHVIRTGLQGNGKTLNTIKEVDIKAAAEGRVVYYCNITGFKPDHPAIKAQWLPFDFPERWFDLPSNSIIVIDEAQTWFRVRPQGSKVPEYASRLEIMRKDGHELHCITQSPKLLDSHMRELCNLHIHYNRGNGGQVIKRWEFQKPELTVNSNKLVFENGESTRITIDKTYFGCYESVKEGSDHHFKFRIPKAAFVLLGCLVLIGGGGGYLYKRLHDMTTAAEPSAAVAEVAPAPGAMSVPGLSPAGERPQTVEEYIADRQPRIPGVPSSAPIYDHLTKPVTFPKPSCYSTRAPDAIERRRDVLAVGMRRHVRYGCGCLSQQGTRMDVPFEACMDLVENGYFDNTRPDRERHVGGQDALRAAGTPAGQRPSSVIDVDQPSSPRSGSEYVPAHVVVADSER